MSGGHQIGVPDRYLRNLGSFTPKEQARLRRSSVFVAGAGGLGGNIVEILARTGVGSLTIADGDVFEPSNLNRQILGTEKNVGVNKAEAAVKRIREINSEIRAFSRPDYLHPGNLPKLLEGQDVVADALGGVEDKSMLLGQASQAGLPLITGFVAGWLGLAAAVEPGEEGPFQFWQAPGDAGAEHIQGCIAPVTGLIASVQCSEILHILCGRRSRLFGRILCADLKDMSFDLLQTRT
ncbi:MAG: HesA/MoeB/ThiF family protein [Desulfonatronovibrionaceae bacterium]